MRVTAGRGRQEAGTRISLMHHSTPRPHAWQDPQPGYKHFGRTNVLSGPSNYYPMIVGLTGTALAGSVYYYNHLESVPITGRSHFIMLSSSSEQQLGASALHSVLSEYRGRVLPQEHPDTRKVARIGKRIVAALNEPFEKGASVVHLADIKWEYFVIDSPMVNAFVLPGGKVCVFTGLLKVFHSEDELGTILGHEIGHVVARHSAEKVSQSMFLSLAKLLAIAVFGADLSGFISATSVIGLELPFSRRNELEADQIGLHIMARACFDPRVAPGVFQKLGDLEGGRAPPKYLNTHPPHRDRSVKLEDNMQRACHVFREHNCDRYAAVRGSFGW